jgi:hypothetical protein
MTIVKKFTYRGNREEWSNTYHFSGGTPADSTHWKALADAMINSEKNCYTADTSVVRAYGHVPGTNHAVWTYDYESAGATVAGVLSAASGEQRMPGDAAGVLQWLTADYTSRGKKIYLRKFFHDCGSKGTGHEDELADTWKFGYEALGDDAEAGWISSTYKICGPNGAAGSGRAASKWITTRTLKRRGRRPT